MCNQSDCAHDDGLDDDFDDIFGDRGFEGFRNRIENPLPGQFDDLAKAQPFRMHEEKCKACRGTGRFVSWSGRVVGDCFKCKGKGVRYFRTTLEQREKAHENLKRRTIAKRDAWKEEHADVTQWIERKRDRFDFARSMSEALAKYGYLTDNQVAACRRCLVKDAEREAQWAKEREAKAAAAPTVSIDAIERALTTAKGHIMYPKLRLAEFVFSLAGENSKNAGSIYVKSGETYLGKITGGRFFVSRDCTPELTAAILAAAANPEEAARAYGKEFGICSCCGRKLTNALSIELGIGPICRSRFGWA